MTVFRYISSLTIRESVFQIIVVALCWIVISFIAHKLNIKVGLRILCYILLIVWLYYTSQYTVWGRSGRTREYSLIPFHQLYVILRYHSHSLLKSAWMNMVLFIPMGTLVAEVFPEKWSDRKRVANVLVCGAVISITIEALQGIFALGLVETDDVMCNTIGALVGYGIYCIKNKILKP